jgi:hypothetical protein
MKLAEKKVIWYSANPATFESVIQSKGESSPIKVNDVDSASIPSTSGTQLSVKVREEKNCTGKESDLLFTNKTGCESLSSDSNLESHGYNSDNDPEYRPKSLSEDTEYDESENTNLGAEEEAVNEPSLGSIVCDYGLDSRATDVRSPTGAEDFSSSPCVQTGSGAHPASYPMGTGGSFPQG